MAIEPSRILVNFLKTNLTDPNSSRSGSDWIYPDFPRTDDLNINSFPRIGITKITESGDRLGIYDDSTWENLSYQIDVITKKGLVCTITQTDDSLGTISNDPRLKFDYIPTTVTNIKHNGSAFGTVTQVATDALFTAPASLPAGTVQWSYSTGHLNFSSADLASYSGQTITSTYSSKMEGHKLTEYLARRIVYYLRTSWRTDTTFSGLYYPVKIDNSPMPFEEQTGIFRHKLEYKFNAINTGE
jgi:hypothetical protein